MSSAWQDAHTCVPWGAALAETCLLGGVSAGATQVLSPPCLAPFLVVVNGRPLTKLPKGRSIEPSFQAAEESERAGQVQLKVGTTSYLSVPPEEALPLSEVLGNVAHKLEISGVGKTNSFDLICSPDLCPHQSGW